MNWFKNIACLHIKPCLGAALVCLSLVPTPASAGKPFKILTLDWTSQIVLSHIFGRLLEKQGHQVEYINKASDSQWFMLGSELANLQVEIWEGSMAERFNDLRQRGLLIDAGNHAAQTREEWWYPEYVEEKCPGLPDWSALNACAELFAEGNDRGRYYTGPWEKPDRARIRALQLDFSVITLKDSDALRQQLQKAVANKQPIMIFNWTPNWIEAVYPGKFIEFPVYTKACETDKSWGINKALNWDCGNPKNGWLKKAVSRHVPEQWPCAYELIRQISFTNEHISKAAALVEVDNLSVTEAADAWLQQHPDIWQPWLSSVSCSVSLNAEKN